MYIIFYLFIFVLGISVGSFLNVLISRLPQEKSVGGRSHCPKCGHQLAWQDLVPVLSFFLLRGKCRYCGQKISWQYPIVEMVTGIVFVFLTNQFLNFEFQILNQFLFLKSEFLNLFFLWFIASCLIVIFVSDLKYFIIPDEIIIAAIVVTLLYKFVGILNFNYWNLFKIWNLEFGIWRPFLLSLLSAVGACAFFLVIVLVTRGRGMGLGDVKLAFLMGLVLGWPKIFVALLFAFVSGAFVGICLILAGKAKMKSEIPFGTFLSLATFLVMMLQNDALKNYLNMLI